MLWSRILNKRLPKELCQSFIFFICLKYQGVITLTIVNGWMSQYFLNWGFWDFFAEQIGKNNSSCKRREVLFLYIQPHSCSVHYMIRADQLTHVPALVAFISHPHLHSSHTLTISCSLTAIVVLIFPLFWKSDPLLKLGWPGIYYEVQPDCTTQSPCVCLPGAVIYMQTITCNFLLS